MYTCARCVYGSYMYACTRFGSTYCQLTDDHLPALWPALCTQHMASNKRTSNGVPLPAGSASGSGAPHPDVARLVEDVVAWQNTNDTRRIPNACAQDSKESNLGRRLARLLLRREKSVGARPSEVQLSPVELALVNSVPGVPFCGCSVRSGGELAAVRQIMQDVAEFGREPKELNDPATETEVAEQKLAREVRKHGLRK